MSTEITVPSRFRPPYRPFERVYTTMSALSGAPVPAPTGPAATLTSAPSLNVVDSSELRPFSVMTRATISDAWAPACSPTEPAAIR